MKKNKSDGKNKAFSFSGLLKNNRVLMILSLVAAFALWTWVAVEQSPEVQRVIKDVPVSINLENTIAQQLGLQIFGASEFKVDVTVTGKKYIVSSLSSEDIVVDANLNYVDSAGTKTLALKISPKNTADDFKITSSSSNYIEVFFDTYKEAEFLLQSNIESSLDSIVLDDCMVGDIVFSQNSVTVGGPTTEVNRIVGVTATAKIDTVLDKTTTLDPTIALVTNDGSKLEYSSVINANNSTITMSVPVLKVVTLPTAIEFKNVPSYYLSEPLQYSISPASVDVAIPVDMIDTTEYFVVDTIDFAEISSGNNTFFIDVDSITTYKIMDTSIKRFKVNINASNLSSKTFTVSPDNIKIINNRDDFNVKSNVSKGITVTVVGQADVLSGLTAENILIQVDTTNQSLSLDTTTLSGKVIINGCDKCWATGKYDIKVSVTEINN